jgi:hypothetical protein
MRGYKSTMTSTFDPDPEARQALADLSDLLADVQEGLEIGDVEARGFFAGNRRAAVAGEAPDDDGTVTAARPFDPTMYNTFVRYTTKNLLRSRLRKVEDDPAYQITDASNLGLHLRHGRYRLRVRKAADLRVPVPGDSLAMRAFYQQRTLLPDLRDIRNLLVLWRIEAVGVELALAKPLDGENTKESVRVEWTIPVPDLSAERVSRIAREARRPAATVEDLDTIRAAAEQDETRRKDEDQQ